MLRINIDCERVAGLAAFLLTLFLVLEADFARFRIVARSEGLKAEWVAGTFKL